MPLSASSKLFETRHRPGGLARRNILFFFCTQCWTVRALLHLLYQGTVKSTFENLCQRPACPCHGASISGFPATSQKALLSREEWAGRFGFP